jgi:ABC-2 type transport system permease protein
VSALLAIARKDLRLIGRDRAALLFLLLVPLVVVTVLAEALAGSDTGTLLLPVVDEDRGPVAEVLIEALSEYADVVRVDRAEAESLVAGEKVAPAALVVPAQTTKRYLASRPSTLELWTDPAKGAAVGAVKAFLLLADRRAAEIADPLFEELLRVEERSLTGSRGSIPPAEQSVPGFSLMFVLMGVFFGIAFGLHDEREWGAISRLRAAPIPRAALLGGKLLARYLVGLLQLALLFAYGRLMFDLSLGDAPIALGLVMAATVFSMTGFSLLVGAFAHTREQVIPLGLTVVMVVCALGGCWFPLYQMPPWLQQLAYATFTAWAMEGLHDVILRERGLFEVLPGIGVLVAYGAVCLAGGMRLHRLDPT